MNRYRQYGQLDDNPEIVGDGGFTKLDMLTDPALLPPGVLAVSENLRFDNNGTRVRGGLARLFPPGTNAGTILIAGVYKPDLGDDQLALVTMNSLVLFATDTQVVTSHPFPGGETISQGDNIDVVQAGLADGTLPQLYIPRGFSQDALYFGGEGSMIAAAPDFLRCEFALYYQDRIVGNATSQSAGVSNFDDFTVFNILNQFQIVKGGDEYLLCFMSYQKDYVLMGTQKAWYVAFFDPQLAAGGASSAGYEGALAGDTSFLRLITNEAGPVGPRASVDANGLIYFISDDGIYAFTPQLDNELTVLGRPISADIQPIMDRFSARYARGAWIQRWGYRLYFALPISDAPVNVTSVTVTTQLTTGLDLPFDLPANLAEGSLATVVTATPHGLQEGDLVQITGASDPELNGEFPVAAVLDDLTFVYANDSDGESSPGDGIMTQKLATRNNRIAVYNLRNNAWESIDTLPLGFYADWGITADFGGRRRLWIVDADLGPALYEEAPADDTGDILGGVNLPFDLPVDLNEANYATTAIPGHFTTRSFRWGYLGTASGDYTGRITAAATPRKIRQCELRAEIDPQTVGTLTLNIVTPNSQTTTTTRNFTAADFPTLDAKLRKLSGKRGLEATIDVMTSGGRPTFRAVMVETVAEGRVEE